MTTMTINDGHNNEWQPQWLKDRRQWMKNGLSAQTMQLTCLGFGMFYFILLTFLLLNKYVTVLFRFKNDDHNAKQQPQQGTGCHVMAQQQCLVAIWALWCNICITPHIPLPPPLPLSHNNITSHHTTPHPHFHHTMMWHHTTMKMTMQWRLFWFVFYIFIHILCY